MGIDNYRSPRDRRRMIHCPRHAGLMLGPFRPVSVTTRPVATSNIYIILHSQGSWL